jgi:type I restriction enzyme S subunit
MAADWHSVRFSDLCQHSAFGPRFSGELYATSGNVATLRTTDISVDGRIEYETMPLARLELAQFQQHLLQTGDLVITRSGRIGTAALFGGFRLPVLPGAFLIRFRLRTDVADPRFYRYFFNSPAGQDLLQSVASGSVQQNLNITSVHGLQVPVPPLAEQRAIAHILGTLDDKIELNRRMSETLESMARALFKSWFIDFDPVRAKAEGRDPGLPKRIADLFPARFVDSELGELPEGWAVASLSDLCSTQYGYTASAVDEPVGPKLLRVTDINKRNWIEWGDVPYCAVDPEARASYALQIGDVLVARMADPGKSAIVEEAVDAVFASYLVRLKTASLAYSYYVYGFLKSDLYAEYSEGAKSGSVQANMNARVIVGTRLAVPATAVIEQFLQIVLALRQRLVANVRESRTLAALRDTLLPKLVSGELRVGDAERLMAGATRAPSEVTL